MSQVEDPGWGPALKGAAFVLVPGLGARRMMRGTNALTVMRQLWITFVTATLLIGVLVMVVNASLEGGGADGRVVAGVIAALGVISQLVGANFLPAIDGRTQAEVQEAAQKHFFLRVALAEPAALLGFLGFVLSANPAVYALGAVVSLAGMLDARPSTRWLDRGQQQLRESGSEISLLGVLVQGGVTR